MTTVPQVQITARDYLLSKGDPPIALNGAIALVAVLYRESRLSPASQGYQSTEHGGEANPHGAYGIASWNGPEDQSKIGDPLYDRQAALLAYAKKNGLKADVLETQLGFVLNEIANRYPSCWAAIRSSASYQAIIPILVDDYEIPANKSAEVDAALAFAAPLAALPAPKPAPQASLPQVPAPQVPIPASPTPAAPAGLPPISATSAGRRAAEQVYIGDMLTQLRAEVAALEEEIAAFQQMAAALGKLNPAPTAPPLPASPVTPPAIPAGPTAQGTQQMPPVIQSIINSLFGNWKTTLSGVVTAAAHGVAVTYPEYAGIANVVTTAGLAALGITATDVTKTTPTA